MLTEQERLETDSLTSGRGVPEWLSNPAFALSVLVLIVAAPFIHHYGEQQGSRYALTAALWDRQTVVIDEYEDLLGRDLAVVDGTIYSDKAPAQPFLMVPFYGAYRMVGGDPPDGRWDVDLGVWWLTLWSAAVPGAILAALMYRWAREAEEQTALLAALTMAFGTMLLVYSTLLFGHVLAALFAFGMFLLVRRADVSLPRLLGAGVLGGAAVLSEYPVALIVAVITVAALVRHRARAIAVVVAGIPAAITLGVYNTRLFGDPLTFPYQWSAFSGPQEQASGLLDIFFGPTLERFVHVLFSPRGLFIATPVVLVALLGLVLMWKRGSRFDAAVAAGAIAVMLAVQGSWANSYAGGAGPRYFVPALPFLVAPLAVAWLRWRVATPIVGAISIVTMVAASLTQPQMATHFEAGLRYWMLRMTRGEFTSTIYTLSLGNWGWLLYAMTVGAAGYMLARASRVEPALEPQQQVSP